MAEKLYELVLKDLKEELKFLEIDSKFYSERNLASYKNISKLTARKVINILVDEGYLYKKINSGTYVKKRVKNNIVSFSFFNENISFKMVYMKSNYNNIDVFPFEDEIKMTRFIILTFLEGKVNSLEEVFVSEEKEDFLNFFMNINRNNKNLEIFKGIKIVQNLNAEIVPIKFFKLLGVKLNEPIAVITNKFYDEKNIEFLVIKSYLNPNNNDFKIY